MYPGVMAVVFLAGSLLGVQAASPRTTLPGSIREVAAAPTTGPVNPRHPFISRRVLRSDELAAPLDFEVALKMRNFDELQARIGRGEQITSQEMAAKYNPTEADHQAVIDWLTSQGFTITRQDANHLAIFATGKVSAVQQAMQVSFARVTMEGKEYTSAVTAPSVPSALAPALIGINGLQPHLHAHKHAIPRSQLHTHSLTGTDAPYLPSQIAQAYNASSLYGANLTGSGQTIAIAIDTFPSTSDLTSFWQTYGISQSLNNIQLIQVVAGTLDSTSGEETLDTEWSSSIAPGAQVRVYAATTLAFTRLDQVYQQIYTDATTHPELGLHQMSMSYGAEESTTSGGGITSSQAQTDTQLFANLVSAGVTLFASSGDDGNDPNGDGTPHVELPSGDPNVTGVGGTALTLDASGNASSEVVWNNSYGSPGGGTSIFFSRPSWQTGTGLPGGTMRAVPDVAAVADPNTGGVVIYNGAQDVYGGTSLSSPIWAGFCALINQARTSRGLSPLGLLGPRIYPLLGTGNFRDITSGSNGYSAGPGFDMATGLGVPVIQTLAQSLVSSSNLAGVKTPIMLNVVPGLSGTLTVAAGGSPLSYQWQRMPIGSSTWSNLSDNGTYNGSGTATLAVSGATTAMNGDQFQCLVTYAGSVTLTTAPPTVLTVETPLIVTTPAGAVETTGNTDSSTGSSARFNYPSGIAVDSTGNVYVADFSNNVIRKMTPSGAVSTPYGSLSGAAGSVNGTGNSALFNQPNAVAVDSSNNLYVADTGNNLIRKITASTGAVSTIGTGATFSGPEGIAVDGSGNVFVADSGHHTIREIAVSNGSVTTLAGRSNTRGYIDATGGSARFNTPLGLTVDGSGNVYVADFGNSVVRKITSAGVVTTVGGQGKTAGYLDGPSTRNLFNAPTSVTRDSSGNLYVTDGLIPPTGSIDAGNGLIRKIATNGVVSTLAGRAQVSGSTNGIGSIAQFYSPQGIALYGAGPFYQFYFSDTYNQVLRAGIAAPVLSVAATLPTATVYGPVAGQFTVTRTGNTQNNVTANYLLTGSAVNGADYTVPSPNVFLPAGTNSMAVPINPLFNSQATVNRSVSLSLISSTNYVVGTPSSAIVTIVEPTPYQAWQLNDFGSNAYVSNIGGPLADPNHNGVPNLLEYAFNSNPVQSGANPSPQISVVQDESGNPYLAITYTQINTDPNITYTVQVTSDLTQQADQWHSGPTYTTVVSQQLSSDHNTTQVTVRDNVLMSSVSRRFIRVQVTEN